MTTFAAESPSGPASPATEPAAASFAARKPTDVRPTLPVIFAPQSGSRMVRVWTKLIGPNTLKISAPSRKNGRSSG